MKISRDNFVDQFAKQAIQDGDPSNFTLNLQEINSINKWIMDIWNNHKKSLLIKGAFYGEFGSSPYLLNIGFTKTKLIENTPYIQIH